MARKMKLFVTFCLLFICFPSPVFAENNVNLRISPVLDIPLNLPQFNTGIGASAAIDWAFLPITNKINMGLSISGSMMTIPVQARDPLTLFEAHAGPFVSFRPLDRLTVRTGLNAGVYQFSIGELSETKFAASASLGLEFHLLPFMSLFAEGTYKHRVFTVGNPLTSFNASVGLVFNLTEFIRSRIRVEVKEIRQYRIFPVSWAWYEHNPVAAVEITNNELNAITDVRLSFFLDSYMGQPWTFAHLPRIPAGHTREVLVTALFNEVMLTLSQNVNAHGVIHIQYRSLGASRETSIPIQIPIFHRNTLSWDDDRRAAAFVSPRDNAARTFARYVQNTVDMHFLANPNSPIPGSVPPNVIYAAAIFEALHLHGITYVVDPTSSYTDMSGNPFALDHLNFPYETLFFRGGDCDDLAILFCSLLEALNIETAFITIPGHLYMAFEIGDNYWMAGNIDIIEIETDGVLKRWLPVEITVFEEGFVRAWRIGARSWRSYGADAELLPIREAWKVFPSVTVSASVDFPLEMPPSPEIVQAMERELNTFR